MLASYAREGYAILAAGAVVHADVQAGASAHVSRTTRTVSRCATRCSTCSSTSCCGKKDGLLKTDFVNALGKVSYHIPCHSRVQNMGQKTREMLEAIPGTEVTTVERCSGHDGTWGVKTEYFDNSMKIGRPVFRQMAEPAAALRQLRLPDRRAAYPAGHGRSGASRGEAHPLTLLRKAYGI